MAEPGGDEDATEAGAGGSTAPEPTDPFENLVLDEDFVRRAERSEPAARHRAPTRSPAAGAELPSRRDRRRAARSRANGGRFGSVRSWPKRHPGTSVGALIVILLVVSGIAGHGPFAPGSGVLQAIGLASRPAHGVPARAVPGGGALTGGDASTSTTIGIAKRNFRPGDCVTWDQNAGPSVVSTVVPCTAPHLVEITHEEELTSYAPGAPFPDELQWTRIFASACGPVATSYLGYALDPTGRFAPGGISPSDGSWAQGDRTLWCGIQVSVQQSPDQNPNDLNPFTGVVRGQDQGVVHAIGSCFGPGSPGLRGAMVPCTSPHVDEVTGSVSIAGQVGQLPPTAGAWSSLVGADCQKLAVGYHGGDLPPGVSAGWVPLTRSDWDAGVRTVECSIGWFDAGGNPVVGTSALMG